MSIDDDIKACSIAKLECAAYRLLDAMPSFPHPGGEIVKVVAHYEDGSTQTISGEIVMGAIEECRECLK